MAGALRLGTHEVNLLIATLPVDTVAEILITTKSPPLYRVWY